MISRSYIANQIRWKLVPEIQAEYREREKPPILIGVMQGALHFLSDLSRELKIPHVVDTVRAKSYEGTGSTGHISIISPSNVMVTGRDVLIVEDIVDTGLTSDRLAKLYATAGASSVKVACLVAKPSEINQYRYADFVGFEIPNEFVIGYGMDYNEQYRDVPFICTMEEVAAEVRRAYGPTSEGSRYPIFDSFWGPELARRGSLPGGLAPGFLRTDGSSDVEREREVDRGREPAA